LSPIKTEALAWIENINADKALSSGERAHHLR
jgi:hypothetical protein